MKAITYAAYGPPEVLRLAEVEKPSPKEGEVLVRVRAASVNPIDCHFMRGQPLFVRPMVGGLLRPRSGRLGVDVAGHVEAVGQGVTRFKPGDEVFGACRGAFAEHACAREDRLAHKPEQASFEAAAAVPVAATSALQGLRDHGRIRPGHRVLVEGASGGVGTFAVQIAKAHGAEVTAVCSTANLERARSLGADRVVDYTREDFARGPERYDLILGANAYHTALEYRRALERGGVFVGVGGGGSQSLPGILAEMLFQWAVSQVGGKRLCGFLAKLNAEDLAVLGDLLATGAILPVIDRRYPLDGVAEAIRYLEEGHARGKVIITVDPAAGH